MKSRMEAAASKLRNRREWLKREPVTDLGHRTVSAVVEEFPTKREDSRWPFEMAPHDCYENIDSTGSGIRGRASPLRVIANLALMGPIIS